MFDRWDRWLRVVLFVVIVCAALHYAGEGLAASAISRLP